MKGYWDSSALIQSVKDLALRRQLAADKGFSRRHALAEIFSALSGRPHHRLDADQAADIVAALAAELEFVDLSTEEILQATKRAKSLGIRGGRIHDYLHALAAEKSGATILFTLDKHDFDGLVRQLTITQV